MQQFETSSHRMGTPHLPFCAWLLECHDAGHAPAATDAICQRQRHSRSLLLSIHPIPPSAFAFVFANCSSL